MRKILLLLLTLIGSVGAWAQNTVQSPSSSKVYKLKCAAEAVTHGSNNYIKDNGSSTLSHAEVDGSYFVFVSGSSENKYYIKSLVSQKYINVNNDAIEFSTSKTTEWTIAIEDGAKSGTVSFGIGNDKYLNNNSGLTLKTHTGGPKWNNGCSLWYLEEYDLFNSNRYYHLSCFSNAAHLNNRYIFYDDTKLNGQSEKRGRFVLEPATEAGTYYIKSAENAKYIGSDGSSVIADQKTAWNIGVSSHTSGAYYFTNNNKALNNNASSETHLQLANHTVPNSGNYCSLWHIDESGYNLTVTEALWSTIYLDYNAVIPQNVNVYAVTQGNTLGTVSLTEVTGMMEANKGYLVKANAADTYFFAETSETPSTTETIMTGSMIDTYVPGDAYVLADGANGVGLYKATLNKDENGDTGLTHFKNNANKAYLPATAIQNSVNALRFVFDEEATAIEGIVSEQQEGAIYNLSGRRVQKAQKGIYIINGKKVVK